MAALLRYQRGVLAFGGYGTRRSVGWVWVPHGPPWNTSSLVRGIRGRVALHAHALSSSRRDCPKKNREERREEEGLAAGMGGRRDGGDLGCGTKAGGGGRSVNVVNACKSARKERRRDTSLWFGLLAFCFCFFSVVARVRCLSIQSTVPTHPPTHLLYGPFALPVPIRDAQIIHPWLAPGAGGSGPVDGEIFRVDAELERVVCGVELD